MKTKTPFLSLLSVAVVLVTGGCVSTITPQPGYLVYYDPCDAGAIWRWDDGIGWSYLGERQMRVPKNHVPSPLHPPGLGHEHPPGAGHHHPPGLPGKPPVGGSPCFFFFGADGKVLTSRDGLTFNHLGHFSSTGGFVHDNVSAASSTAFRGAFNGAANSFHVDAKPIGAFQRWAGSAFGSGSNPGASFAHNGGGSFGVTNYPGGATHGSDRNGGNFHGNGGNGGSGGSSHPGGWSGGGGSGHSYSGGGGGHSGGWSGGGGGGHSGGYSGGGGGGSGGYSGGGGGGGGHSGGSSGGGGGGGGGNGNSDHHH